MKQVRPHILVACALAVAVLSGFHVGLRNALVDLRFASAARDASGDVVVVAIDPVSIEKIGVWPWPRRLHADLLRRLDAAGVQDVAFDIDFSSPSDAASDQAFVEALKTAGGSIVLPSFRQPIAPGSSETAIHVNRPLPQFAGHAWSAVVNVSVEADGRVRRYPFGETLDGKFMPSMSAVLAGVYDANSGPFLIDFSIRTASIPIVSYVDVLRGDAAALARLRNRKIIVGSTALELGDRFSVPNGAVVSGPVLQALAVESMLQKRVLHLTSAPLTLGGLGLIALLMALSWRRLSAGPRVMLLLGSAAVIEAGALMLQVWQPLVLDTSLFHAAIAVYIAAIALDEIDFRGLLSRIAESRFQRIAMSLGDGLVCADTDRLITVWNPGAAAIFGYQPEDIIGQRFETLCGIAGSVQPFLLADVPRDELQLPGGKVFELEGHRKNGTVFPLEVCLSGWQGADGFQYGAILRDISLRKREAERMRYLAEHDTLTGLPNRYKLHARIAAAMVEATAIPRETALLVLAIDDFQQLNDMLGHACGDDVLCAVSERLIAAIGADAFVARLDGDEFAIAIHGADIRAAIPKLSQRLFRAFEAPLLAGARLHRIRVSVGGAVYPGDGASPDELLGNSHLALQRAKSGTHGSPVLFARAIRDDIEARLTLEAELAVALERGEFELFYQPQVRLSDGGMIGAEALIRWRHPSRGMVSPAEFMPVVNTSSISDKVAAWVLKTACTQARAWERAGHALRVGVNLSPSQFQSGDLAASVREALDLTGLTPALLELEVTEDILLVDERRALDIFAGIQDLGVRLVFDDFGTGYASLSYLKKFPLDGLKIDRSFVIELRAASDDAAIVGSTVALGKKLGLSVIAEGIEDRATADLLISMGCEEGQGYFFGRPMPAAELEKKLALTAVVVEAPELVA